MAAHFRVQGFLQTASERWGIDVSPPPVMLSVRDRNCDELGDMITSLVQQQQCLSGLRH